jgi:hemerythrin-like domain-containing protein
MIAIDKFEEKIEKLKEKVAALTYNFKDEQLKRDADAAKEDILAGLEDYLDLLTQDAEQEENSNSDDDADAA